MKEKLCGETGINRTMSGALGPDISKRPRNLLLISALGMEKSVIRARQLRLVSLE
jgi:hypothetical protein